jgi:single-strand DNA-binding protein
MNSCILMATILEKPELRKTQDGNLDISSMTVEFEGVRPEDPTSILRAIGWGSVANEIHEKYTKGDRVILEGRLAMNVFDNKNTGYKEKRAELTVQRIYPISSGNSISSSVSSIADEFPAEESDRVVSINRNSYKTKTQELDPTNVSSSSNSRFDDDTDSIPTPNSSESSGENLDNIPF